MRTREEQRDCRILMMFLLSPSGSVVKLWQNSLEDISDAINANAAPPTAARATSSETPIMCLELDWCFRPQIIKMSKISVCFLYDVYVSITFTCLFSDHNPLTFLHSLQSPNQRLIRWSPFLQPFPLEIRHIKGVENVLADALSRAPCESLCDWFSWCICFLFSLIVTVVLLRHNRSRCYWSCEGGNQIDKA